MRKQKFGRLAYALPTWLLLREGDILVGFELDYRTHGMLERGRRREVARAVCLFVAGGRKTVGSPNASLQAP
jgi:hypothetical protein